MPKAKAPKAPPIEYVEGLNQERRSLYQSKRSHRATDQGSAQSGGMSLQDLIQEIQLRRQLRVDPVVPKEYRKTTKMVRGGQALFADACQRIISALTANSLKIKAIPLDEHTGHDAQAVATKKEEWTVAVLLGQEGYRGRLDIGETSLFRDCVDNIVNAGRCSFMLTTKEERWSESAGFPISEKDYSNDDDEVPKRQRRNKGEKLRDARKAHRRAYLPFVMERLDPLSAHVVKDSDGVEDEAVVVTQRPYRKTLSNVGLQPNGQNIQGDAPFIPGPMGLGTAYPPDSPDVEWPSIEPSSVEVITYFASAKRAHQMGWTDGKKGVWAYYVEGNMVDHGPLDGPADHPLPVFQTIGLSTAILDDVDRAVPVSLHFMELADELDEIDTMLHHLARQFAFPLLLEEDAGSGGFGATGLQGDILNTPESVQQNDRQVQGKSQRIVPGGFYEVPPGRTWRYLSPSSESQAIIRDLRESIREKMDLVAIPSVFRGAGGPSQAGYAIAQLTIMARSLYDPVIDNWTATIRKAVQYLWWQVWAKFSDGIPAYFWGDDQREQPSKWLTLTPKDIAPDGDGKAGSGTPFLACTIQGDPMLPIDEAQLERRGIDAVASRMVDRQQAQEKYFNDPSPERTQAAIMADSVMEDPLTVALITIREQVRAGLLAPKLAPMFLASKLGIDPEIAAQQMAFIGIEAEQEEPPGPEGQGLPPPGVPGPPGRAQASPESEESSMAPPVPAPPPTMPGPGPGPSEGPGAPMNTGGAMQQQPTTASQVAMAGR